MINIKAFGDITKYCLQHGVTLVAVSKTKPVEDIMELYRSGQRVFGENKVQELVEKAAVLPKDIQWHLIGHLQTNKVKQVLPFVTLIHSVDSFHLLSEIDKQSAKLGHSTNVLLQIKIAQEDTKYGLELSDFHTIMTAYNEQKFSHVVVRGLMGMASLTDDFDDVGKEFASLRQIHKDMISQYGTGDDPFPVLSMGMSGDYLLAVENGSNMVRIGSLLFGER